jgi:type IV secretory pathway VirB10-like protein
MVSYELLQRRQNPQNAAGGYYYPSSGDIAAATAGREMSQTASQITRKNLNIQPTIKVPVGYRFTVRVNRDMLFEGPYEALDPVVPREEKKPYQMRKASR